jgi:hypothetical protein
VIPGDEGTTPAGTATVARLRTALASVPGGVEVGGNTAQNVDFNNAVYGNFPLMLAVIALLTFLLLARALRSAVLALKAVLVNLVSLGASFGFLVAGQPLSGRVTTARVPPPGRSVRVISPWWARAISRAMARPRPVVPVPRSRLESRRTNRSKTRLRSAAGMPGPSSSIWTRATWPSAVAVMATRLAA